MSHNSIKYSSDINYMKNLESKVTSKNFKIYGYYDCLTYKWPLQYAAAKSIDNYIISLFDETINYRRNVSGVDGTTVIFQSNEEALKFWNTFVKTQVIFQEPLIKDIKKGSLVKFKNGPKTHPHLILDNVKAIVSNIYKFEDTIMVGIDSSENPVKSKIGSPAIGFAIDHSEVLLIK